MRKLDGLQGAVHGSRLAVRKWAAIEALYERVWPGMPARLRNAESLGARWADCMTPFTWFERGRALATVGVLAHPVRLARQERKRLARQPNVSASGRGRPGERAW